ncbi:MAG: DNA helicase RecQ [Clostridium sp.]
MNNKEKAFLALEKFFGYKSFREGQLEIILNILNGRDCFCLMPTGAGKSVCYQIPALIFSGITLVISPLISLMKDQVDNLEEVGIRGAYINSTQSIDEIRRILQEASLGIHKLIYIAPERLESRMFIEMVKELNISQVAIDEAHCVSEWGHDFRKSYTYIKGFINALDKKPVVSSFTATATNEVRVDSINLLGLDNPYTYIGDINRENLYINVYKEEDKLEKIKDLIRDHENQGGIIYCSSRNEVEGLYTYLKDIGFNVGKYHGGLRDEEKEYFQNEFLYENIEIMVATNAFGMGIDKSNVRYVIHFTLPKDLESYYQEIGRGGRDGSRCDCYLLYNREDIKRVEFIINKSSGISRREISLRKLQSMIEFCEESNCYRSNILKYFNKEYSVEYCTSCKNCLDSDEVRDFTREAQILLSTVFRTREGYGISIIVDIVKGIKGPKIINNRLTEITTFGLMKEYTTRNVKAIIDGMLKGGFVSLKEGTYSMLKLNERSIKVLKFGEKVFLRLEQEDVILNEELYNKLRLWRKDRAIKERIKPYIIFSDTVLIEISNILPKSPEQLLNIRGVGEKKVEKYGEEIIKMISSQLCN